MVMQNFIEGQTIKNYKELCKILEIPVKAGDSKKAQLKELERYCKYKKDGNKFVIEEIYNEAKEKVDNRGGNHNIFGKYIDQLLLDLFSNIKTNNKVKCFTADSLARTLGIINNNYLIAANNKNKFFWWFYHENEAENINKTATLDFFKIIREKTKSAIRSSLKRLEKAGHIEYREDYIIFYRNIIRAVNDAERKIIINIENELLQEFETTKFQLQFHDSIRIEYYGKLQERVRMQFNEIFHINLTNLYKGYEITLKSRDIKKLTPKNKKEYMLKLNQTFEKKVIESLIYQHNKTVDECKIWGKLDTDIESFNLDRLNKNYVNNGIKLFQILCKNFKDIKNEILYQNYDKEEYKKIRKQQYNNVCLSIAKEVCNDFFEDDKEMAEYMFDTMFDKS